MIRAIGCKPTQILRVTLSQRLSSQVKLESVAFRSIRPDEAGSVCKFGEQEMTRTFRHLYSEMDFADYVSEAYTAAKYLEWITSPNNFVYGAFAQKETLNNTHNNSKEEDLVAYVLAGPCGLPVPPTVHDPSVLHEAGEIKRIYAHPSTFGSGISANCLLKQWNGCEADKASQSETYI